MMTFLKFQKHHHQQQQQQQQKCNSARSFFFQTISTNHVEINSRTENNKAVGGEISADIYTMKVNPQKVNLHLRHQLIVLANPLKMFVFQIVPK